MTAKIPDRKAKARKKQQDAGSPALPGGKTKRQYHYTQPLKPNGKLPTGRPTTYKPEYCQMMVDYFDRPAYRLDEDGKPHPVDLPLVALFAHSIVVNADTLYRWRDEHIEFSEAFKKSRERQEANWATASLLGLYNPAFTIFAGKNMFGWRDKQEVSGELNLAVSLVDKFDK